MSPEAAAGGHDATAYRLGAGGRDEGDGGAHAATSGARLILAGAVTMLRHRIVIGRDARRRALTAAFRSRGR